MILSSKTPATKDDVKNDSVLVKDYFQQMETFLQSFGKANIFAKYFITNYFSESTISLLDRYEKTPQKSIL